jgi:hypothetical protein
MASVKPGDVWEVGAEYCVFRYMKPGKRTGQILIYALGSGPC